MDHQKPSILLIFSTLSLGGCGGHPMRPKLNLKNKSQISTPNEYTYNFKPNLICIFPSVRAKFKKPLCPRTPCTIHGNKHCCAWKFWRKYGPVSHLFSCKRNTRGKNENMAPKIIPQNWFNPLCTIFLHRLRPISTSRKDDPIHFKESTGIYFDEELHYWSAKKTSGRAGSMGVRYRRAPLLFFLKHNQVKVHEKLEYWMYF